MNWAGLDASWFERSLARTEAGREMMARVWMKSPARTALLLIAGVVALGCAYAQQPAATGSLTGKLTDAHSSPLENVTVTLRNAATGAAVQTTTAHHGRYRFTALAQGEYTLTATGPSGTGQVNAIYIASGHESQVQTAIVFHPLHQESAANVTVTESAARQPHQSPSLKFPSTPKLDVVTPVAEASLSPEKLVLLPLNGTRSIQPETFPPPPSTSVAPPRLPNPPSARSALSNPETPPLQPSLDPGIAIATNMIPVIAAPNIPTCAIAQAVLAVELGSMQASIFTAHADPQPQLTTIQAAATHATSQSSDSVQLQALPLPGRNWQNFLLDTPPTPTGIRDEQRSPASTGPAPEITVEGARTELAFGSANRGQTSNGASVLINPASSESAMHHVQMAGPRQINVITQRGTEHLHGQAFVFDRQHLWSAQNPFTQWVCASASASTSATCASSN